MGEIIIFHSFNKFMRESENKIERIGGNVNHLYSFILFFFNIASSGREKKFF